MKTNRLHKLAGRVTAAGLSVLMVGAAFAPGSSSETVQNRESFPIPGAVKTTSTSSFLYKSPADSKTLPDGYRMNLSDGNCISEDTAVWDLTEIDSYNIECGKTIVITPSFGSPIESFETTDENIAVITKAGSRLKLTAKTKGMVQVTIRREDGKYVYFNMNTVVYPESIEIPYFQKEINLMKGETSPVIPTVLPDSSTTDIIWSSSNTKVATVSTFGSVKAVGTGSATITASTVNGLKAVSKINVFVPITSFSLVDKELTVESGMTAEIRTDIQPAGADQRVKWSSDKPGIATVENGIVSGVSDGTATITAEAANGKKLTCKVTVKTTVKKIRISKKTLAMGVGEKFTLAAVISPTSARNTPVKWISSDSSIVEVTKDGKIKAKKEGRVTIAAEAVNGRRGFCKITVKKMADSVKLSETSIKAGVNETVTLNSILPDGTAAANRTYTSSDSSIVSVVSYSSDTVTIKAMKAGTAKIKVKLSNGKTAACNVTVKKAATSITLDQTSIDLGIKESVVLDSSVPSDTAAYNRTFTTSDSSILKLIPVDGDKVSVQALKAGSATVTVKTSNGRTAVCKIAVKKLADSITMDQSAITIGVNETVTLKSSVPTGTAMFNRFYVAGNDTVKVKKIDADTFTVKGLKEGSSIVTAMGSGMQAKCRVTVMKAADSVSFDKSTVTLRPGTTVRLNVTVPAGTASYNKTYKTGNSSIAAITGSNTDSVTIKAVKEGTTNITVKTSSGKTATCKVVVTNNPGGTVQQQNFTKLVNYINKSFNGKTIEGYKYIQLSNILEEGSSGTNYERIIYNPSKNQLILQFTQTVKETQNSMDAVAEVYIDYDNMDNVKAKVTMDASQGTSQRIKFNANTTIKASTYTLKTNPNFKLSDVVVKLDGASDSEIEQAKQVLVPITDILFVEDLKGADMLLKNRGFKLSDLGFTSLKFELSEMPYIS